jgi:hypothetical protein
MMDGLSAVGLAGTIAQLLDFMGKLAVGTYEIYSSANGKTAEHTHLDKLQTHIVSLSERLELDILSNAAPTESERDLLDLARKCKEKGKIFQKELLKVKAKVPNSKKESFKQTLKGIWKTKEFHMMEKRVNDLKGELALALISLTKYVQFYSRIRQRSRNANDTFKKGQHL